VNTEQDTDDIFGKTGNGTLVFCLSESEDWNDADITYLNISIGTDDLDAIYSSALRSKGLEPVDTSGHYDWQKYETNLQDFIITFPQYPMMVSYQDMYQDYILGPNEISDLLEDCRALQKNQLSTEADLALRKLIYGLKKAGDTGQYLIFVCD